MGGVLGAAVTLAGAYDNDQQRFVQRRDVGIRVLSGPQHEFGLQIGVSGRLKHLGAEWIGFGEGYAPELGLDGVFFACWQAPAPVSVPIPSAPRLSTTGQIFLPACKNSALGRGHATRRIGRRPAPDRLLSLSGRAG